LATNDLIGITSNGATEAARILNSGFIGVGTATPGFVFQSGGTSAGGNVNVIGALNNATNANTSCTYLFTCSTTHDVQNAYIRATRDNVPASGGTRVDIATFNGTATTTKFGVDGRGTIYIPNTITAAGTTGDRTIDKVAGSVNIAAAGTAVTVTNACVSTNSLIYCTLATVDATAKSAVAVAGSGSFVITLNAAATAEVRVNWFVIN
jgi:hypothetical protein